MSERVNTGGLTEVRYPRGWNIQDSPEGMQETKDAYTRARERQRKEKARRNTILIIIIVAMILLFIVSRITR